MGGLFTKVLSFLPFDPKTMGIVVVGFSVLAGIFYFYYTDSQKRIEALNKQVEAQAIAVEIMQQENASLKKNFASQAKNMGKLDKEVKQIRKETGQLAEMLSRHDFGMLVKEKPGLLEKRINTGTKKVFGDIKGITQDETK